MKNTLTSSALVAVIGLALTALPSLAQTDTNTTTPAAPASTPAAPSTPPAPTPAATPSTPSTPSAPAKKASKPSKSAKKTQYSGKITALSATSITVQGKEALTLAITPTTKFRVDKKKSEPTAFAVGDSVTGSYTKDATGAMTAASIDKKSAAPAAK